MYSDRPIRDFTEHATTWSWYIDKLKQGKFEDILGDEIRYISLQKFWNQEFKNKNDKNNKNRYKLLFLSISKDHIGELDDVKKFLLNRFEIKSKNIINLDVDNDIDNDCNDLRYIIPILDPHFNMLEDYCFETSLKLNSGNQSIIDYNSEYNFKNNNGKKNSKRFIDKTYYGFTSQTSFMKLNQIIPDVNEEDAIVLNFSRSKRCQEQKCSYKNNYISSSNSLTIVNSNLTKNVYSSRSNFIGSTSEVTSIASYASLYDLESDAYYDENENITDLHSCETSSILNRVPTHGSNEWDIQIKVNILIGMDSKGDIWQAVKETEGDDWIIYDSKFSLTNIEYCTLDDILLGNIDDKEILMLFCKVI